MLLEISFEANVRFELLEHVIQSFSLLRLRLL